MPTRQLDIAVSTFNFPPIAAMTRSPEWYEAQVSEMGVDGILGSEINNIHPQSIMHGGLLKALVKIGIVERVHQSWRSKRPGDMPAQYRATRDETGSRLEALQAVKEEALLIGSLPHISTSLDRLGRLQAKTKKQQRVIVHPDVIVHPRDQLVQGRRVQQAPDFRSYQSVFPGRIHYQPTPELVAAWGTPLGVERGHTKRQQPTSEQEGIARRISDGMRRKEQQIGLNNPYLDFQFLTDVRDGYQFGDPLALVQILASERRVAGVQLGWRPDLSHDPQAIKAELNTALHGNLADTTQGKMLRLVSQHLPPGTLRLDIEVPATVFADEGYKDYVKANATIAEQARQLV